MRQIVDWIDGAIVACAKAIAAVCFGAAQLLVYVQALALCLLAVALVGGLGILALQTF